MTQESGRIWVMGGRPLNGTAAVPAAKNSVLPLLAAALLCRGTVRLRAVPALSDVECCLALLRGAGCDARRQGADVVVSGTPVCSTLPGDAAARMRASILFCAPLLARLGRAETSLPGGCPIGQRPIDLHLEGLGRMGAKELDAGAGRLVLAAPGGLHGADFTLRFPSVGATETLLLAAVCARGTTVLRGAAREPEISDLADFLRRCGGQIEGAGTSTIRIEGRRVLSGCDFSPLPDRIFASTLACAAAAAGGRVELAGCPPGLYEPVLEILEQIAPPELACSWDNVGLLVDAGRPVTSIMTALDITADVVRDAAESGCELIVSHHPVIFDPLRRVTAEDVPAMLLQNGISAICMHTNLDAAPGGVNDVLADLLRIENRRDFADNCGRIGTLNVPTTAQQLAETCSRMLHTHCKFVEADRPVEKLAEVSGAGGSYLQQAIDEGADCLVTGEAAHHIAILAKQKGVGLVVAGHWGTEHPVVFALADALTERLPKEVTVAPSLADVDPYSYL